MARRKSDAPIDLGVAHVLTAGLIAGLRCPEGKEQAFLRDAVSQGLRVRVTKADAKSFVFEAKVDGKTLRRTIGGTDAWAIEDARKEANRLRVLVDQGTDPRELDRRRVAQAEATAAAEAAKAVTVGEAWARYLADRKPHWGERHYSDHVAMVEEGGVARKRLPGAVTKAGPLAPLMSMRLVDLDTKAVEAWAAVEAVQRPARLRLALRLLKAFLRWASTEPDLADKADVPAASARRAREAAGRPKTKDDVLERGQLAAWFAAVRGIPNQVTSAYLQTLLLVGARPGEVITMRWEDINIHWKSLTLRDKVEGERQIPLTPFVWSLLSALPRRNEWVFSSSRAVSLDPKLAKRRARYHAARGSTPPVGDSTTVSGTGRLMDPDIAHHRACAVARLDGLTLNGLRRSFASLTEWLEVPAGVVAQIQGHKPSATAEKHYKRRPLDLLRVHHERIEAWMLEQAEVEFQPRPGAAALRTVT